MCEYNSAFSVWRDTVEWYTTASKITEIERGNLLGLTDNHSYSYHSSWASVGVMAYIKWLKMKNGVS